MGWNSNPREACMPAGFQDRSLKRSDTHPKLLSNYINNLALGLVPHFAFLLFALYADVAVFAELFDTHCY